MLMAVFGGATLVSLAVFFLWRERRTNHRLANEIAGLKRAEGSLALKSFALDQVNEGAFLCTRDAGLLYVNEEACRSLGYSREELLGMTVFDIAPDLSREDWPLILQFTQQSGRHTIESRNRARDGRIFPIEVTGLPIEYRGDVYFLVLVRDVTERKRTDEALATRERELRDSEQRFRLLAENFPDFLVRFDGDCRYLYVNPMVSQAFGVPVEEFIGRRLHERRLGSNPGQDAALEAGIRRVFATGNRNEYEARFHLGAGEEIFEIRLIPEKDADGSTVSVLGIGRNVTRLRAIEQALLASEREFRMLAENSPDLIMRYGRDLRRKYVNPAYEREILVTRDQALDEQPDARWKSVNMPVETYKSHLLRVMETGVAAEIIVNWPRWEGGSEAGVWHYAVRVVAERDLDGRVMGVLAIGRNITELLETERRLGESHAQLRELTIRREEAREEERKRIARDLHDELGQLLTALRMDVSLLRMQFGKDNPPLVEQVKNAMERVDAAIVVVRDVASRLRPAVLDMGVAYALAWQTREFARKSGVQCTLDLGEEPLRLDDERATTVFRIVQESLTNIVRHARADKVEVTLRREGQSYQLEISDNGVGFEVGKKTGRKTFGLLGMRERALALGGDMTIISQPGQGTTVRVSMSLNGED